MKFTGWPDVLDRVVNGLTLDRTEAALVMSEVLNGRATSSQLAALLAVLRSRGETIEEMSGFVDAMRSVSIGVPLPEAVRTRAIDTCGTGGDRSNTINVSTIASFVVAAAGVPVCKHGNRAASSKAGAADVLEALRANIDPGPEVVARCVSEIGIGFAMAPTYHPSLRFPGPTRKELGIATVFNLLGPLVNPGRVERQLVGVPHPRAAELLIDVLRANGSTRAMVVHGLDGLDELTTTASSMVYELRDGLVHTYQVDPRDFGFEIANRAELTGGDAAHNAGRVRAILGGESGPQRDLVLLNAAAALVVGGAVVSLHEGMVLATATVDAGKAAVKLDEFVSMTNTVAG